MASTSKKWFIGCGIGCGLMILITAGIGGGLYFAFKDVVGDAESIDESFEALESAFGSPRDFTPAADGAIAADRLEVFLTAREAMADSRDKMADILKTLDGDKDGGGKGNVLDKIKAGITLIPAILTFVSERNEHLLDQGMGVGEYTYIYSLAYFAYLEKDLTDGPSFQMTGSDDHEDSGFKWKVDSNSDEEKVRTKREKEIRRHLHNMQLSFLINQISAMNDVDGSQESLRVMLEEEKSAMDSARRRLLWEENLPESIRASLEPFAERLDESYSPILNVLEVGMINSN